MNIFTLKLRPPETFTLNFADFLLLLLLQDLLVESWRVIYTAAVTFSLANMYTEKRTVSLLRSDTFTLNVM